MSKKKKKKKKKKRIFSSVKIQNYSFREIGAGAIEKHLTSMCA
jgi:hypothetical protein